MVIHHSFPSHPLSCVVAILTGFRKTKMLVCFRVALDVLALRIEKIVGPTFHVLVDAGVG